MPTVLIPGKLLYLATPRTASTVVGNTLATHPEARTYIKHAKLSEVPDYQGELVVTGIRNPYDALVSWHLLDRPKIPLHQFLAAYECRHFVENGRLFWQCGPGVETIRYENLIPELNAVLERVGLSRISRLPKNVRATRLKTKPWREYYDRNAIVIANARFGDEIVEHGYDLLNPDGV